MEQGGEHAPPRLRGIWRVMISSTTLDLREHREQVIQACLSLKCMPLAMEHLTAATESPAEISKQLVNEADVVVSILGVRYGTIPTADNPHGRSITEMEYWWADDRNLDILPFLSHPNHPFTDEQREITEEGRLKLKTFRELVGTKRTRREFMSAPELRAFAGEAISNVIRAELQAQLEARSVQIRPAASAASDGLQREAELGEQGQQLLPLMERGVDARLPLLKAAPLPLPHPREIGVAVVLLVMAAISVVSAYVWFGSSAWVREFGVHGWEIELGRAALGLLITLIMLGAVFREEADLLLPPVSNARVTRDIKRARHVVLGVVSCAFILLIVHHVWLGPAELFHDDRKEVATVKAIFDDPAARKEYLWPYLWYMGYSFTNMIAILTVITSISMLGSIKDARRVSGWAKATTAKAGESTAPSVLRLSLWETARHFRSHINRAAWLVSGVGTLILYETLLGWSTLSDGGKKFALLAYFLLMSASLLVVFSWISYRRGYAASKRLLAERAWDLSPLAVVLQSRLASPLIITTMLAIVFILKLTGHLRSVP